MNGPTKLGPESLRARARERIEQQVLPRTRPARTWGGRGTGQHCSLCDEPILDSEPEMELEYESAAPVQQVVRFHLQCQSAWEAERQGPRSSAWTSVDAELPPLHATVEARISLGEGRVLILSVMRVCDGESGPVVWLNATTNSQLPEKWIPVEWRALPAQHAAPVTETKPAPRRTG
jgi:hypothetical protein